MSSTTVTLQQKASNALAVNVPDVAATISTAKPAKLNFVERFLVKKMFRKMQKAGNEVSADQDARSAETWGWIGIGSLAAGLFLGLPLLFAIPAGIVAITKGNRALKNGTSEEKKAKKGKLLGTISLIGFAVLALLIVVLIAALIQFE